MNSRHRKEWRHVVALGVKAWFRKHGWRALWPLVTFGYSAAKILAKPKDIRLVHPRLKQCHVCPVFNWELKTCGTSGDWTPLGTQVGCWCYLPVASACPSKICWARLKGMEFGWTGQAPS